MKFVTAPRRKCAVKERLWGRIIWRKRGTDNVETRGNEWRI